MTYYVRAGVRVDKKHSDERQVTLKDLSMKSTGRYRCEVSTEAPTFETVSSYGDMIVVGKERTQEDFPTFLKGHLLSYTIDSSFLHGQK